MQDLRKHMMDRFAFLLLENYKNYQEKHIRSDNNLDAFVTYLIDHNLIELITVKRYTILEEYPEIFKESERKTDTVVAISQKFNISERTVWAIIKDHQNRFDLNNDI